MCGIAGVVSLGGRPAVPLERLKAMCDTIVHRGPDDEGLEIVAPVALGMRRLSIIDVAGGHQPLYNEDRTVRVVFNGEIYNFRELRADLEARGHRFRTATDGEVIAHLWEEHGSRFVERLNGMFAIALHDSRRRRFVLARDRLGIKPLFFALSGSHLVFGSEIKALLASGLVERELDPTALVEFVSWEYVPAPRTLLRAVRKLDAAGRLELDLDSGEVAIDGYWELPAPGEAPAGERDWSEAVEAALQRAVRRQLVSDVPLGAFLSGGVDSSLVVSAMGEARTFSIGFDDPSYNELAWSQRVATHLGVDHTVEVIRPDVVELFEPLMRFMDDPIGDFSIFPTYLVSRLARRHVTVSLSGDGGDELFGGYESYVAQQRARIWHALPGWLRDGGIARVVDRLEPREQKKGLVNKARRFVEGARLDPALGHARWRLFAGRALRERLFADALRDPAADAAEQHVVDLFRRAGDRSEIDRCLYVDMKSYLVDNCLVKVDRMSMACSLEVRVPLLDHELVELAFRVPPPLKVDGGRTKVLLKKIAARHVPREAVYRPKEGFSIPIKRWLAREFRPLMEELLDPRRLAAEGIFRPETVESLKRAHLDGRENHSHLLWAMMVFQDWRRRWAV